ncbi:MAG: serine/threonine-protein phosphatase, partial [Nitrososphaera sp.]|nr:serine/threonine-protein phosphatase [Nitrososphaera sp.]
IGVCDGMGGRPNGDKAAAEVVKSLSKFLSLLDEEAYSQADAEMRNGCLRQAILKWYADAVTGLKEVKERENLKGLGTTVAAGIMFGETLAIWWLGDSRIYRFREGRLERLTSDHSKVEQILNLSEDDALEHAEKSILTKYLRPEGDWEPDIKFSDWRPGDVILAMSDGVWESSRTWELETFIAYLLAADTEPKKLCDDILEFSRSNIRDNATIAVAIRDIPKPFTNKVATLTIQSFRMHGLRQSWIEALTAYPSNYHDWKTRGNPPWRNALPHDPLGDSFEEYRLADHGRLGDDNPEIIKVCLTCGTLVEEESTCPQHGDESLWKGLYAEVVDSSG